MKLGKYIYQLLLENETVIIPGFGAFISDYKPAVIDLENSEVKPPSKNISFTSKIRNNDGLLVDSIAEAEGISHFNALKTIEKERDKIQIALDKGSKVKLEDVGMLWFNNNEIEFEPGFTNNMLLESFGLDVTSLEKTDETESEIDAKEIVEERETPDFKFTPETPEEVTEMPIETLNENEPELPLMPAEHESETISETIKDAVVSGTTEIIDSDTPLLEIREFTGEKQVQETVPEVYEDDSDQKLINYWKENQENYYEPEPKSNRSRWWLLLILIPLGIGVYFLIGNRQKSTEYTDSHQKEIVQKSDNQSIIPSDTLKSDSISTDSLKNAIEEKKTEEPVKTEEVSQKYYLVGGSFSKEENMENYIVKLKKKGIEGIRLGKKGKFFIVGIARFETEKEAYKALNAQMRTNPENELWVLKK